VEGRIAELCYREEIMWRQHAWVQWLIRICVFFHQKANNRRKKNRIERLVRADGQVCVNNNELEKMAMDFYEDLYKSEGAIGIEEVLSHVPRKVSAVMNADLIADYTEEEVNTALFQMFPTKAPGPEAHFFQKISYYVARS
jgi:hypothetical protein